MSEIDKKAADFVGTHIRGLYRGGIPGQLTGPRCASCQGLGGRITEGRHFGEIVKDSETKMGEAGYL